MFISEKAALFTLETATEKTVSNSTDGDDFDNNFMNGNEEDRVLKYGGLV